MVKTSPVGHKEPIIWGCPTGRTWKRVRVAQVTDLCDGLFVSKPVTVFIK